MYETNQKIMIMIYNSKLLIKCLKIEYLLSHKLNLYYSTSSSLRHNNSSSFTDKISSTTATAKSSTHVETSNKKVLIVDDEEDIANFFKLALEHVGFVVDKYNDPLKSLSNFRAGIYDLLLLDIRMPQMSGFELYNKIRKIDDSAKVCFITAFEEYYDEFKRTFSDLHEEECFIRKPISMNDLIRTVKSHFNFN
jgi:CheY-like chemotaxis protein